MSFVKRRQGGGAIVFLAKGCLRLQFCTDLVWCYTFEQFSSNVQAIFLTFCWVKLLLSPFSVSFPGIIREFRK